MIIPYQRLAQETLDSLLESYINREGTDYGISEQSLKTKVDRLKAQVVRGDVVIVFDNETESFNLLPKNEVPKD